MINFTTSCGVVVSMASIKGVHLTYNPGADWASVKTDTRGYAIKKDEYDRLTKLMHDLTTPLAIQDCDGSFLGFTPADIVLCYCPTVKDESQKYSILMLETMGRMGISEETFRKIDELQGHPFPLPETAKIIHP